MTDNLLSKQLDALLFNEHNPVSNLANASALLYSSLKDINWAGFYLYDEQTDSLDLGPFKGKLPVCTLKTAPVSAALHFHKEKPCASQTSTNFRDTSHATLPQILRSSFL